MGALVSDRLGLSVHVARDPAGALGVLLSAGEGEDLLYRFLTPADARLVAESLTTAATLVEMEARPDGP